MSLEVVGLGKLLQTAYADKALQKRILRIDLNSERKKAAGHKGGSGPDFYMPFWADAKQHVMGNLDLNAATAERIAANPRRTRLYNLLKQNFLMWWEQKRRLRNEPFSIIQENLKARFEVPGRGTLKVENTLAITIGEDGHRIFYPYFCEEPALSGEAARLGLWVMSQSIKRYDLQDMRMLDVIRGKSFSTIDTPLLGNEETLLNQKYGEVIDAWKALRPDYDF
ncbi:hypothetical protein LRX75_22670 [Rhizobium sp. DKSPLA3]|uniref:Uncharacterized protein n=1 Tax=Rhizobium quercicola TaxID=2901226 RepID=A0A9X1T3D8_9HYPH|nr:hypothetical protein [Rhizobium quercicola]MCD7111835.1 hypothetical protein [Rhizobium quercicola]